MAKFSLKILIAFIPVLLSACELPKIECDSKQCVANCCCKTQSFLEINEMNYSKYLKIFVEMTEKGDSNKNYYRLICQPSLEFAYYNCVTIVFDVYSDVEGIIDNEIIFLDSGGYGSSRSYLFTYSDLIEKFNDFHINKVFGKIYFKL